jgi:carbon starvation protein
MSMLLVVALTGAILLAAYAVYGTLLTRLLRLDASRPTPAVELRDDVDYSPIDRRFLLGQHFSAIAAAGPIVGPILAGLAFGWLPALLWIVIGGIFVGGVHDITALTASIRHKARSIAEIVREHMSRRSYLLFLAFIWFALIYIVIAFTDITASSFVGVQDLTMDTAASATGEAVADAETSRLIIRGGAIATSSLLYLALPIALGLVLRFTKIPLWLATIVFLPLVAGAIWIGPYIPFDVAELLNISTQSAQKVWCIALLAYCCVASVVPMWLLLQPRGYLGGFFLYAALLAAGLGVIFGGQPVNYPAFRGWQSDAGPLMPLLFITIACGACSGFHSLIASGTTSKQLRRETDAKLIGYGAMLMESMVAVVSLCCVMMLAADSPLLRKSPNFLYARGIGSFLDALGLPGMLGVSFGLMAFTTFVYDTLDVCTRLGRYVIEELTGWHGRFGRFFSTALTASVPVYFLLQDPQQVGGKVVPIWRVFWDLFGASNQLLAALTLTGVTVWLWRTRRAMWAWFVTGIPAAWMYFVSVYALARQIQISLSAGAGSAGAVPWISLVLILLAAMILLEALTAFIRPAPLLSGPLDSPVGASAGGAS